MVSASCFSLCRVNGFLRSPETCLNQNLWSEHPWTFGKFGFSSGCRDCKSDVFLIIFILRRLCPSSLHHTIRQWQERCCTCGVTWNAKREDKSQMCIFLCHCVLHELQNCPCKWGLSLAKPGYAIGVSWGRSSSFLPPPRSFFQQQVNINNTL